MVCEQCGKEFDEGRNCPHCGALAIFVNDDEYTERKQAWEEENTPQEENPSKKFSLKIHINPIILKKVLTWMAVVCFAATAIILLIRGGISFFTQEKYCLVYDNGEFLNSTSRGFEVYSMERAVFSVDGNYIYQDCFEQEGIPGSILAKNVDVTGQYGAVVSVEGTDSDAATYYLYHIKKNEQPREILSSKERLRLIEVSSNGDIFFEKAEIGAFEATLNTSIYRYDGNKCSFIVENISDFLACEEEQQFIFYDMDLQAYLYQDGNIRILSEGQHGSDYVVTGKGTQYYVAYGNLVLGGKNQVVDSNVTPGTLMAVVNSERVLYVKDGSLYCYGGSFQKPVKLIEDYAYYEGRCQVVEHHGILSFAYDNVLYQCSRNGTVKKKKDGIKNVYLSVK